MKEYMLAESVASEALQVATSGIATSDLTIFLADDQALVVENPEGPSNSEIKKIADDVLNGLKISFASVASNPDALYSNTVEMEFQSAIRQMSDKKKQIYVERAKNLLSSSESKYAIFGRYANYGPEEFSKKGLERIIQEAEPVYVNAKLLGESPDVAFTVKDITAAVKKSEILDTENGKFLVPGSLLYNMIAYAQRSDEGEGRDTLQTEKFLDVWGPYTEEELFPRRGDSGDRQAFSGLEFCVAGVKCVDETNPEWLGDDEIALGAVATSWDGRTTNLGEKFIGSGFNDGKFKGWAWPSLVLTKFPVPSQGWPKTYRITLLLAEKDSGGFANALRNIWEKISSIVIAAVRKAIQSASSWLFAKLGLSLGSLAGPIGAAIGAAVGYVIGCFVNWIISAFDDDIFPAQVLSCKLNSATGLFQHPYDRRAYSREAQTHFYGFGGHYYVQYYWRLTS